MKKQELEEEKTRLEILKSKQEYLKKAKIKLSGLLEEISLLEKDIAILEKHMSSLKENIFSFSSFNNTYKKKKEERESAKNVEKDIEISIAEMKKEKEIMQKEIFNLREAIQEKETKKKKLSNLLELIDWLQNQFLRLIEYTERNVLMRLRVSFANIFSKWFNILVATDSIQVQIDESFTPLIIHGDTEMDYSFLSGGERTAIALAYRLALNQTLNSILSKIETKDIVILDEPTDGFSETQINRIRDLLVELNASQLIIVSHEQKIEGFVENILRVKKEADISKIQEEGKSELLNVKP
jgi:exonuclease SbcC